MVAIAGTYEGDNEIRLAARERKRHEEVYPKWREQVAERVKSLQNTAK